MSALLQRALARHPERAAFVWDGGSLSCRATAELIGRMQAVLSAAGFGPGTRVALLAGNQVEAGCAGMAAQASGMVTTWLHQLGSQDDHLFQLRDFSAEILVVDASDFAQRAADLAQGHQGLRQVYTLTPADIGRDLVAAAHHIGYHSLRDLSQVHALATVNYTGGTTGRSTGAMRSQAGYAAMIASIVADFGLPERPHYLTAATMTHVAGTLVQPTLMRGGTVRLMAGFQPGRLLEGLQRIGPVFAQLYGQTEGYPVSFLDRSDHDPAAPDLFTSCGMPTSISQVCLLDAQDQPVPPGEPGELCVRGPQVVQGYLNQPELTAETLRGGWLHTGDMARADARGHLYIVDRKKDMIVSGGFNVCPRDVEDVISGHPAVAMVAVIGVPDAKSGEAVTAMVQLKPGASGAAELLIDLVRQKKGKVQAPKAVDFIAEMPRTAVGKIDKKLLRAPFWAGQARQVG